MQENGIYKVFSVIIAIALAIYVNGERNPFQTRQISVPLEVENQEQGILIDAAPTSITVDVSGPRNSLTRISSDSLKAMVNLKGRKAGTHVLRVVVVAAHPASMPSDVTWIPQEQNVPIKLVAEETRSRPLIPVFLRPAPAGFSYGPPVVRPPTATLSGPRDAVTRVAALEVLVDAQPAPGKPVDGLYEVRPVDTKGITVDGVRANPPTARVRTEVQQLAAQKEVLVSPSITGTVAPGYRVVALDVVPRSVLLAGSPDTLSRINMISTRDIDLSNATGNVVRSVTVPVPDGVTIQGSNRVRVEVTIKAIAVPPTRD